MKKKTQKGIKLYIYVEYNDDCPSEMMIEGYLTKKEALQRLAERFKSQHDSLSPRQYRRKLINEGCDIEDDTYDNDYVSVRNFDDSIAHYYVEPMVVES